VTFHRNPALTCRTRRCLDCGFVAIVRPEQSLWIDKGPAPVAEDRAEAPVAARIGTRSRPGREFHMAKMAADMLARDRLSVLVFGAGTNLDNLHIAQLDAVQRVAIGDIMRIRDDPDFVDLTRPAREQFDIVVASEVVEHFRDPRRDFAHLFGFVAPDGLVVAGTNIHAGNNLAKDRYIFYPDHSAYYSPRSLRLIANDLGFHIDFRAPMNAKGMRKRYVFFSRSRAVLDDVATYFGTEVYPPSEVPRALQPPPQRSHAAWRDPR
jgi:SAM-dependent methyltransferase